MTLISWNDELATGIESIDVQHQHLVNIINRFDEAMQQGKGSRVMNEILNDLVGYTQEHFADEERIMSGTGYEGLAQHQAKHRQLLQKVERFQFEFNASGRRVTTEVREFLTYWLVSHILKEDKGYAMQRASDSASAEEVPVD